MKTLVVSEFSVLIDDEDYEKVKNFGWYVQKNEDFYSGRFYFNAEIVVNGRRTTTKMHRIIMGCVTGDGTKIDHINGNTLDNRKQNLRFCSGDQNAANKKLISKNNTSGYKGVAKDGSSWRAQVGVNNKIFFVGLFKTKEDAAKAYDNMAIYFFGPFARTNFEDHIYNKEQAESLFIRRSKKELSSNTSGIKGVAWSKQKKGWFGRIVINKKAFQTKIYETKEEAYSAYLSLIENKKGNNL